MCEGANWQCLWIESDFQMSDWVGNTKSEYICKEGSV